MKYLLIIFGFLLIGGALIYSWTISRAPIEMNPVEKSVSPTVIPSAANFTPYQASFAIFTNGTARIFTDPRYHNLSDQLYLTAATPNVVYVQIVDQTWQDLFDSLPMQLSVDCLVTGTGQRFCNTDTSQLKFYINGQRDDKALSQIINPVDKLLVSFGPNNDPAITFQLQQIPERP